jgi:hypothetical protein
MKWICTTLAFMANLAVADSWLPPYSRVFASEDGRAGVELLVPKTKSDKVKLRLFTFDGTDRKVAWERTLDYVPHRVFVAPSGQAVVTMDMWGRVGYDHALVIYDNKGKTIKDAKLEDLLTQQEISEKVMSTVSSRWWSSDAETKFVEDDVQFEIKLSWGKTIRVATR